jgi:hypothetical protein
MALWDGAKVAGLLRDMHIVSPMRLGLARFLRDCTSITYAMSGSASSQIISRPFGKPRTIAACTPEGDVASKAWKDFERRAARALGGERSGPLGRHHSDAIGTAVALEAKYTTRYSLRATWIEQARRQSKDEGKPWLLAISQHNDPRPIAVVDFHWLADLLRKP